MLWFLLMTGGLYVNPVFVLIGSLIPDSDIKSAPAARLLPMYLFFKHRGPMHRLWVALPVSGLLALWDVHWGAGLFVGWFSHLMLDSCTRSGLRLWLVAPLLPFVTLAVALVPL
jgi:membrane-bound metal-dependent hydrolase YbcI (DUF457 family)